MTFNIEEAVQTIQLKKVAKVLAPMARKNRKLDGLVKDLEKGKMPKVSSYKKNDDVVAAFAEVMGPDQTMKLFGIKEETYSPQKHEWGTDASRKFAKEKTPGEKKEKEIDEAKFSVDIEGLPRFYMDSDSPGKVKKALRSLLKKPAMIKDVERTPDSKVKADYRGRAAGKEDMEEEKKMKGKDPCWKGYEMVGTKKKNGKEVPNCVPKEETEVKEAKEYFLTGLDYKGTKHTYKRRGPKMTDPIVVYIDGKEWKTFKSMPLAKKETLNYIKGMKEEVEQVTEATSIRVDIPYFDDEPARAKKVQRKHRVKVVDKGRDYQITGDKKNIVKFLMDKDTLEWRKDEIEDEFPELFESVEQTDEAKNYNAEIRRQKNIASKQRGKMSKATSRADMVAAMNRHMKAKKNQKSLTRAQAHMEEVQLSEKYEVVNVKTINDSGEDKAISYGRRKGYKDAGVIGDSPIKAMVLFHLKPADKKDLKGANIKAGEQVFRYATRSTVSGDIFPLIKVNLSKGMVYYLTQESSSGDIDEVKFETRGAKLKFARMVSGVAESVELSEKSVSQAQQKMMGMALAYKRGEMDNASDEVKKLAKSMSEKDLEDFAKTKHKGLPMKKVDEAKVDGVEKGSLEGDQHMCATKIMHNEWNEGTPLTGEHAVPDENGHVSWYKVMFEHGIETVHVDDESVTVLMQEGHGSHKKMKKESFLSFSDYISEKKKLSPAQLKHMDVDDDNDIDGEDLAKIRAKKK